ncbi:MAG: hypothetical protein ACI9KN_000992 [Gammaproteobacteria bacterium]|jgi:hypothetical protein
MLPASRLFYVQDEQYVTGAWMRRSDDVQDEQYVTGAWMRRSDDVQDERVVFCSCKNDTSASLGGRMSLTHGRMDTQSIRCAHGAGSAQE